MPLENPGYLPLDGWIPVSDTWAYASANTITVPTDATLKYPVGTKVKFTQTTVKYGVVTVVAATLLTIAVNTDYVVANAAITAPFFSLQEAPLGYPGQFNYAAAPTGFSAAPTNTVYQFSVVGNLCTVFIRQLTAGTSNATTFTLSAPIVAKTVTNGRWSTVIDDYTDNSVVGVAAAGCDIASASSTITLYTTLDRTAGAWTNANTKRAMLSISYPI